MSKKGREDKNYSLFPEYEHNKTPSTTLNYSFPERPTKNKYIDVANIDIERNTLTVGSIPSKEYHERDFY